MQSLKNSKNVIKNKTVFRKSQMVLYDDPWCQFLDPLKHNWINLGI